MAAAIGFDTELYLREQTAAILERVAGNGGRLYLEFGGKILFDYHAARVLPGFDPNVKLRLLQGLGDKVEVIVCIHAGDIERRKMRADFGHTYDHDTLKLIDDFRARGIEVQGVVVTRYADQPSAARFRDLLERRGVGVVTHRATRGYPTDVDTIVSDEGYGANPYIGTKRPIVAVTGPGPGSGKLATCLSQLYHEHRRGVAAGYAKFETFPIWNLPLKHPVNVAYEAATADLSDCNVIDPFYLEAYGKSAVNYNRDVEAFPLLRRILARIAGGGPVYRSPTDMGVNRAGFGIVDDGVVREAARQEIIRRHLRYACEYALGLTDRPTVERAALIMNELELSPELRPVYLPAHRAADDARAAGKGHGDVFVGAAIRLRDGSVVTGCNSPLMHASSSLVMNAIKRLAGIPDMLKLLSENVIGSIGGLKRDILKKSGPSLDLEEALIALAISATTSPTAQLAMARLSELSGCEMHMTHIPSPGDEEGLRRLGVNLTCDPNHATGQLLRR